MAHKHRWGLIVAETRNYSGARIGDRSVVTICRCKEIMPQKDAVRRLNAVECLSPLLARDAKYGIEIDTFGSNDYDDVRDALEAYATALEGEHEPVR